MKITKERICTALTLGYHLLFLGGTTTLVGGYLDKIEQLENRVRIEGEKARKTVDDINKTGKNLDKSVKSIENEMKKVRKACGRLF